MAKADHRVFRSIDDTDYTDKYKQLFRLVEQLTLDTMGTYSNITFRDLKNMIEIGRAHV